MWCRDARKLALASAVLCGVRMEISGAEAPPSGIVAIVREFPLARLYANRAFIDAENLCGAGDVKFFELPLARNVLLRC